tara:strand:+ start:328 stop:1005 length:678 start_codon:yes stop_codon:yes gene_type:complete
MSIYKPIPLSKMREKNDAEIKSLAKSYYKIFTYRRTIRDFSNRTIPEEVIRKCIKVASMAPSGANHQPWHFVAISNMNIKTEIRKAAEKEEEKFYSSKNNDHWLRALEPIGTGPNKVHLERAPWLIAIFAERYGLNSDGSSYKHYYVPESVGIASGFLISAIHQAGLYCLVHTPNPMKFLTKICNRPSSNKPVMILAIGHPAKNATVPYAATIKKPLDQILTTLR